MKKKGNTKTLIFYILLIAVILFSVGQLLGTGSSDKLTYSKMVELFKEEKVKSFEIDETNNITIQTNSKDGNKSYSYRLRSLELFHKDLSETIEQQREDGIIKNYNYAEPTNIPWWVSILPYVLMIGLFVAFWIFMTRQANGKGGKINAFGRAKAKLASDDKNKVYFKDVAGADEEKEEMKEFVDFLRDPKKFTKIGAKIPHGALLVGPPGTGKTLLAKAVAGEAGVPFYSISGSDFVEMYVGVGASRVRDLFETARKSPASIIFIDEIDAVGRHRGAGLGGGHDEREQTLNQLLVEMDGFGTHDGVIVLAATNRPDILDPALLRPGRFDRQITVGYPDLKGRKEILEVHARNKQFSADVDFEKVAQATPGFTGADLANLLNESALLAARKNKVLIGMDDIEEATLKIMVGPQKKSMKIKPEEKRKTAYHEAGHAILAYLLPSVDPVTQISVIPSGRALGYTLTPPTEDKYSVYKNGMKDEITMLLGGRVAEKIIFDDISGGASNDIERATKIAKNMVTKLGMSDKLGPIVFGSGGSRDEVFLGRDFSNSRDYSESIATQIDEEIHAIIHEAYEKAEKLLRENIDKMHFIAEYLCKHETMDDKQFETAMKEAEPTEEMLVAIEEERAAKRREENEKRAKEEEELRRKEAEKSGETKDEKSDDSSDNNDDLPPVDIPFPKN
ncbi:MAG: ATP-dependent metallopeptidase FtsH/Yme1/Tma family protein [Ruminococcaceae bacterium]|nr:ATP-dependent metallopeptidase FtsH/Yme1/Tma family protein [Oscillospiraceae bacterium]